MFKRNKKKISDAFFTVLMIFMALFPFLFIVWLCLRLFVNLA